MFDNNILCHMNKEFDDWKITLQKLSQIRGDADYSTANINFVREHLSSEDDRIRAGAALAAEGCLFEQYVLNMVIELAENDPVVAIRRAAVQAMGSMIYEGVMQDFEDETGADTDLDYSEEWDEIQAESLRDEYIRVKNLLLNIVEDEYDDLEVRESALLSLSEIGYTEFVQDWIKEFFEFEFPSAQLAALKAAGKYPQNFISQISRFLDLSLDKSLVLEAISSSYSSQSAELAGKIENLLSSDDIEILEYAILTLGNINKTPHLGEILQSFGTHSNPRIKKAARQAIENFSKRSFTDYLEEEFGME